jgi:hypothetical protein
MMMRLGLMMFAVLAISGPAEACRSYRSPAQKLSDGYAMGAISAIARVTVEAASYSAAPFADAHPWSATATVVQLVRGTYAPKRLHFTRGWGAAACDEGYAVPKVGDLWIIYFTEQRNGDPIVWASYPVSIAADADMSLQLPQIEPHP